MSGPGYQIVKCPECNGSGEKGTCGWCGGGGRVTNTDPGGEGEMKCSHCNGSGVEPGTCPYCYGSGEVDSFANQLFGCEPGSTHFFLLIC